MFDESAGIWFDQQIGSDVYRFGQFNASATIRKTKPGKFDLLIVGAGGTGGSTLNFSGGGGAGAVRVLRGLSFAPGLHSLAVGAAPVVANAKGGDTIAFGFTAPGGGAANGDGGNGGGGNGFGGSATPQPGGTGTAGKIGGRANNGGTAHRAGGGGGSSDDAGQDATTATGAGRGGRAVAVDFAADLMRIAPGGNGGPQQGSAALPRPEGFDTFGAGASAGLVDPAVSGVVLIRYKLPNNVRLVDQTGDLSVSGIYGIASNENVRSPFARILSFGTYRVRSTVVVASQSGKVMSSGTSNEIKSTRRIADPTKSPNRLLTGTSAFVIKQGDTSPALALTLVANGKPVDLTNSIVVFHMRGPIIANKPKSKLVFANRQARVVDAENGSIRLPWRVGDTAVAGDFDLEVQVTYEDGTIETFPNDKNLRIKITPQIA